MRPSDLYFAWDEAAMATLVRLAGEGRSGGEIAKALGCSRNAVIGKAHRTGVKLKGRPPNCAGRKSDDEPREAAPAQPAPKPVTVARLRHVASQPPPPEGSVSLAAIRMADCRWPYGDPKAAGFRFCGCPVEPGKPYCASHAALAYRRDAA